MYLIGVMGLHHFCSSMVMASDSKCPFLSTSTTKSTHGKCALGYPIWDKHLEGQRLSRAEWVIQNGNCEGKNEFTAEEGRGMTRVFH